MSDLAWFDAALTAARPQALGALLRYFRDLDTAEEAFQEACLRALKHWPVNGPPRDPAAWLILVGRNAALDHGRREARYEALPSEELISDLDDAEAALAERLDGSHYRDDVLRLLFICCHPELPATQQIALALRIVAGRSVKEIARAFLVSESAMEQRITRAKRRIAEADVPFETPGPVERAERVGAVAAMIYLIFNEGYSASGGEAHIRLPLCEEAIRLARLLLRLFQGEPEIMGLTALLLLQHARAPARLDADGGIVLLEDQDRSLWDRALMAEGLALVEKARRHGCPGPYQIQAAIAAVHAGAARPEDTDWEAIDRLYAGLETLQPSPVVTLNRAVAVAKVQGPAAALALIEPLAAPLSGYFHFFGVRGALLVQLGRAEEARVAFDRAIALAHTPAEAAHIRQHLDRLMQDSAPRDGTMAATHAHVKTDKIDAGVLASLHAAGFLPEVWLPDGETERRRRLVARRNQVVRHRTRVKNETHGILAAHLVPPCPHAELFNGPGRAWLARQVLPDDERAAIERHLRELDRLGEDLAVLDHEIAEATVDDPAVRRLLTIAGINVTVAAGLVAAIGDIRRFSGPQKLVSYFGLNPRVRQSGLGFAQHGRISKIGRSHARAMLVEAAWAAAKAPGPLHAFFVRIRARRGHQIAAVATARKMAVLVWHLLAKDADYLWARPALVAHKLRALELQAGRPVKKGNRRGPAYAYNVKTLRNQEMAIAEQAEHAYEHFVAQWRPKPTTRRAGASPVTGSSLTGPAARLARLVEGRSPRRTWKSVPGHPRLP